METLNPALRKAAILMRSLDADSAAVLLSQLSADEARAVREAMRELGTIDPSEQEALRGELIASPEEDISPDASGVELAFSTDSLGESNTTVDQPIAKVELEPTPDEVADDRPFAWLERGDLPSLAAMLEREHLSTVAVVLSHLPPDRASQVLTALPAGRRASAIERLADLGESDRQSLEVIESKLAEWILAQKEERRRRADRMQSIQAILEHSSQETCRAVLSEIAGHDAPLAKEIGSVNPTSKPRELRRKVEPVKRQAMQLATLEKSKTAQQPPKKPKPTDPIPAPVKPRTPRFRFGQLAELNREQLAKLFGQCANDRLVLALAGAPQAVSQHVEKQLPKNVARELRRRMLEIASVKLSDFTAAQLEVATVAERLFLPATSTVA